VISTRPKLQKLSPPRGIQKLQLGSARADGAEAVVELTGTDAREVGLKARSLNPTATTKRRVFARLSIAVGNALQIGGILAAYFALRTSRLAHSSATAVITMFLAWVLLYFSSHAIAHWLVGRVVGIRFLGCVATFRAAGW
jgi:hypothetical protein